MDIYVNRMSAYGDGDEPEVSYFANKDWQDWLNLSPSHPDYLNPPQTLVAAHTADSGEGPWFSTHLPDVPLERVLALHRSSKQLYILPSKAASWAAKKGHNILSYNDGSIF